MDPKQEPKETAVGTRQKRHGITAFPVLIATVCLLIAMAIGVIQAELLQGVNKDYQKPYFITYWSHISYVVFYIVWKVWRVFPTMKCNRVGDGALTNTRSLMVWSGVIALLAMATTYLWILSLGQTNIPANTAIFQSVCAIVFIISVPILKERVTVLKVFCVVISIAGVSLLSVFSDNSQCQPPTSTNHTNQTWSYGDLEYDEELTYDEKNDPCNVENSTPLGYVFLGSSILGYSFYQVLYKKFATKENDPATIMNSVRILGYIGLYTLLGLWPPMIVLHFTGYEVFELPPSWTIFGYLIFQQLLGLSYMFFWFMAIALTSPLYSSIGTMLATPCSVLVDWHIHNFLLTWPAFCGMVLILVGFIGFVVSQYVQSKRNSLPESRTRELRQTKIQVAGSNQDDSEFESLLELPKEKKPNKFYKYIYKYLV